MFLIKLFAYIIFFFKNCLYLYGVTIPVNQEGVTELVFLNEAKYLYLKSDNLNITITEKVTVKYQQLSNSPWPCDSPPNISNLCPPPKKFFFFLTFLPFGIN